MKQWLERLPRTASKGVFSCAASIALFFVLSQASTAQIGLPFQWIYNPIPISKCVAYSPDGSLIAIGGQNGIQVYSTATKALVECLSTGYSTGGLTFLSNGKTLASFSGPTIYFWDVTSGRQVNAITGSSAAITSFAFSPDGSKIAATERNPLDDFESISNIELWNLTTGVTLNSAPMPYTYLYGITFSPDGSSIAIAGANPILEIVSSATLNTTATFNTSANFVTSLAFSPDGKTLADVGLYWDSNTEANEPSLDTWDVVSHRQTASMKTVLGGITALSFSPDGTLLAAGGSTKAYTGGLAPYTGGVELWSVATSQLKRTLVGSPDGSVNAFSFSPDGRSLAASLTINAPPYGPTYSELALWTVSTGTFNQGINTQHYSYANGLALSPDGTTIATSGSKIDLSNPPYQPWIGLWDTASGNLSSSITPSATVSGIAISPDGRLIADFGYVSDANSDVSPLVEIWNLKQGTLAKTFPAIGCTITSIAFGADSTTIAVGGWKNSNQGTEGVLQVWSLASGKQVANLPTSASQGVNSVVFSQDGSILAACGAANSFLGYTYGVIELWDSKTHALITSLDTGIYNVEHVAFTSDGKSLADSGLRLGSRPYGGLELWNISNATLLSNFPSLPYIADVSTLTFSPDGTTLFAGSEYALTAFNTATYGLLGNFLGSGIVALAVTPDNSKLALLTYTGTLAVATNPFNLMLPIATTTLSPTTIVGGYGTTGTVTLAEPAPSSGFGVKLTSSNSSATVPEFVEVQPGATTATFTVTTTGVTKSTSAVITAGSGSATSSATLSINPAAFSSLSAGPASIEGGESVVGLAVLNGLAPTGGLVIRLKSSDPKVSVPASVTIPAGQQSAYFNVKTQGVTAEKTVTITGTNSGVTQTASFVIYPNTLSSFGINPYYIAGGTTGTGSFTLYGKAPAGGMTLKLASDSSAVSVPASVLVPEGKSSGSFMVRTEPVATQTNVTITATFGGISPTTSVIVTPPILNSLTLKPASIKGGKDSIGTVKLGSPAPRGGVVIALVSNLFAATLPKTVTIPGGSTTAKFTIHTAQITSTDKAVITATMAGASQQAVLTITSV